jgi:5-amino-6-(5-phosphoribosylamino)uracil reductase
VTETAIGAIDWQAAFGQLWDSGLKTLAVLGGGALVASLLEANLLDELWLTVCPLLLGGVAAPYTCRRKRDSGSVSTPPTASRGENN